MSKQIDMSKNSFTDDEVQYMRERMMSVPGEDPEPEPEPNFDTVRDVTSPTPPIIGVDAPPPPSAPTEPENAPETESVDEGDEFERLPAESLRQMLRDREQPTSGTKPELIERLRSLPPKE